MKCTLIKLLRVSIKTKVAEHLNDLIMDLVTQTHERNAIHGVHTLFKCIPCNFA
jgi:hypothetical protein